MHENIVVKNQSNFQVYNASAGSGKTFTLVKEYLKVVLNTSDSYIFQRILAITFTNKAAAEMKQRVLDNLQLFSEGDENDLLQKLQEETGLEKEIIQNRSRKILETILRNYSAFGITTIDSFTHKIIKSFAFDLGLTLNFEVELDSEALLQQAVAVLISKIGIEKEITKTLIDFSLEKAKEDKSWDISLDLNDFAKVLLNDEDAKHFETLKNKTIGDFTSLKNKLIKAQKDLHLKFEQIGKNGLSIIDGAHLDHKDFYRSMLPKHFSALQELDKAKFFDESVLKKRIEERLFYAKSKSDEVKASIEEILPELLDLYAESENLYEQYVLSKLVLKSIIPLAVLTKINSELSAIKEEHNIRLISEFNQLIYSNIKGEPAPFIYERVGQKFMHYFIDEMQDTSVLQWQNLIPLIDNALAQEQSNLLLVGDAKQAIYRWRGGRAEQFIKLGSELQNDTAANPFQIGKEVKGLETNYRSYSEVINFNNSFFQYVASYFQNPMYQKLFEQGNTQKSTGKIGGFVSVDFLEKESGKEAIDTKYAKRVLETILNLDPEFSRKDVCILVRKKKEGVAIANYLSENGVAIVSSETLLIQNSPKVNFIINFLQVIQHSNDHAAWVELLYFLHSHLKVSKDIHAFISCFDLKKENTFFTSIAEFGVDFDFDNFRQIPFYEKVEEIIRAFRLAIFSDAYVQSFLDVVFEQQQKGVDIQQFLEYWEVKRAKQSIVAPEAQNAIQIMTIHKSKGLEFPVVIFPYNIDIYQQIQPKSWMTGLSVDQFEGFDRLLVNADKNIKYAGDLGAQIYHLQREELELDSFNLLYVALTRSVEQLYVITEKSISSKGEINTNYTSGVFMKYLIQLGEWNDTKNCYIFGDSTKVSNTKMMGSQTIIQDQFVSNPWQQHNIYMLANASKFWHTEQGEAIEYGNLIHELFSKILSYQDIKKVIAHYLDLGMFKIEKAHEIESVLCSVVQHPKLEAYYMGKLVVFNEREIATKEGGVIIPDRLVFTSHNEVVLIDYKTGAPSKRYHQQLVHYENVLNDMGISVQKKLLIYLGHEIKIEEI